MASIALTIGLAAGSMALQYLFAPKIKQQPTDVGKNDDIRITGSDYGAFIPRLWGKGRVGGQLIFSDGITHTIVNSPSGGGKGVPQAPSTRTHIYTTSIFVLICRGEVQNFLRIWQDADLVLGNGEVANGSFQAELAALAGGASTSTSGTGWTGTGFVTNLGLGGTATFDFSSIPDPTAPPTDPDEIATPFTRISMYYKTATDKTATVTCDGTPQTVSFSAAGTDWTTKTIQVVGFIDALIFANAGANAPDLDLITIEKYYDFEPVIHISYSVTGIKNPNIAYPKDINDPSEYYNYPAASAKDAGTGIYSISTAIPNEAVRFYSGTETQTQDSAIIAWLDARYGAGQGALRASAMRGLAGVMFQNKNLKGGRVENYTFELDMGSATVNTILAALFADVGLAGADYNITATSGLTQIGFLEHTNGSRRSLIESLGRYHQFRLAEIDGKIKTVIDIEQTPIATLSADNLRAHADTEEYPRFDAELVAKEEHLLPREVRVSIMNPALEYHNESVTAQLFASISATESKDYTFPIVDTPANARNKAEKLLLKEHAETLAVEWYGMPSEGKYSVGDVIARTFGDVEMKVRIEKKQSTLPIGKIRFQGVRVQSFVPTVYQDDTTNSAAKATRQYVIEIFPRNTIIVAIQSLPITEKDSGKLGVYLAVCGRGRGVGENSALYREMDADNFVLHSIIDSSATVGLCEDVLATHGNILVEDTTNFIDIWFFDDIELESVLQADIDRHPTVNLIRVGGEWLQFRTATAQTLETNSPYRSKWRISNLWRGRFETSAIISAHAADEYATVVTPALRFVELDRMDEGETVTFKAVTGGQSIDVAPETSFTFAPISKYPITNYTTRRTLDGSNYKQEELKDLVLTVIEDLHL